MSIPPPQDVAGRPACSQAEAPDSLAEGFADAQADFQRQTQQRGALDAGQQLASAVAATRLTFLQTELSVGHTMLHAAASAQEPAARARRVANAQAAHDEVARHLASDEAPQLSDGASGLACGQHWPHWRRAWRKSADDHRSLYDLDCGASTG